MTILDLGPLRKDDALTLVSKYFSASNAFTEKCIARAAGNPLFLEQLLRNKEGDSVPGSVQSIVQARLDQLNHVDAEVLRAASVLGQRFSLETVRYMIESNSYSCSNLIAQDLVRPEGEDNLFTHALVRDGVYQSMTLDRRKELHSVAAKWFAENDPVLYARHLDMAGDRSAPLAYLVAAKAQAKAHFYDGAIELCKSALTLGPERTIAFALLTLLGDTQLEANEAAASIKTFEQALSVAETSNERVEALMGLAAGMRIVDQLNDAEDRINAALVLARQNKNYLLLAKCLFLRGNLSFPKAEYNTCIESHKSALEYARSAGSVELEVQALGGLSDAYYLCGRMKTAREFSSQCVQQARQSGLTRIAVANLPMLAEVDFYCGELDLALKHGLEAIEEARSISHARAELIGLGAVSYVRAERGDIDLHIEAAETIIKIAQQLGSRRFEASGWSVLGRAHHFARQSQKSREFLLKALDVAKDSLSFSGPSIMGGLVLAANSAAERNEWISKAQQILQRGAVSFNYLGFYADVIEACLINADWDGTRRHSNLLAQYTADEPLPWSTFMIQRARWAADMAQKSFDENLRTVGRDLVTHGRSMGLERSLAVFTELAGIDRQTQY